MSKLFRDWYHWCEDNYENLSKAERTQFHEFFNEEYLDEGNMERKKPKKAAFEKALKDKLKKDGVSKKWMQDHLIVDFIGFDDEEEGDENEKSDR